jgi:hypothetical protein
MTTKDRTREQRLRRKAERQGLALRASGRRDPHAFDYGKYVLVNAETNAVVAGTTATGRPEYSLDDVEQYLTGGSAA